MTFLIKRIKTWWGGLPLYGKILTSLVWVLIGLFFILFLVGKILGGTGDLISLKKLDKKVEEMFDDQDEAIRSDITLQEKEVAEAKKAIMKKVEAAEVIDRRTKEDTRRIRRAKTMEELDALQEELGL